MFLKIIVGLLLALGSMLLIPKDALIQSGVVAHELQAVLQGEVDDTALASGDAYLQALYENGEVIACSDEESLETLLFADSMTEAASICTKTMVENEPRFLGWVFLQGPDFTQSVDAFKMHFFDPHNDVSVDSGNVVARKYVMDTKHGEVQFVWPYPLDEADYALFSGSYETPEELKTPGAVESPLSQPPTHMTKQRKRPSDSVHMVRANF